MCRYYADDLQLLKGRKSLRVQPVSDEAVFSYKAQPAPGKAPRGNVYGIQNRGVQNYLPIAEKRELTPQERADVQKGLKRWFPRGEAGYSTPLPALLASPKKAAAFGGSLLGVLGGLGSAVMTPLEMWEEMGASAARVALVAITAGMALVGAVCNYSSRKEKNEKILYMMGRLPEGATQYDLLSDPVYGKDLDRDAIRAGNGQALLTGMMLSSAMAPRYGSPVYGRPAGGFSSSRTR